VSNSEDIPLWQNSSTILPISNLAEPHPAGVEAQLKYLDYQSKYEPLEVRSALYFSIDKLIEDRIDELFEKGDYQEYLGNGQYKEARRLTSKLDAMQNPIENLPEPSRPTSAATKHYVDSKLAERFSECLQQLEMRLMEKFKGVGSEAVRARVLTFSLLGDDNG